MASSTNELRGSCVAIYARYSSDRQSEASIEDQVRLCRRFVEDRGGSVLSENVFMDHAVSGTIRDRAGLNALVEQVNAGTIGVVITEDISRLSRDKGDVDRLLKSLRFHEVRLLGVSDGTDTSRKGSAMMIGFRSVMSEVYLDDLRDKTRRGMEGRAQAGKVTGKLPFGFRSVPSPDGQGKLAEVDPKTAPTVVRLFEMYAAGESQRGIAAALNEDGIAPPHGNGTRKRPGWVASSVRAMLKNPRYVGMWAWNERRFVRDPVSRKRRSRRRPESEVIREQRDLRIVSDELWAAVSGRFARNHRPGGRRQTYLLTGILRCAECGGSMQVCGGSAKARYYGCADRTKRGTCDNATTVPEPRVRERVLTTVRDRFLTPAAMPGIRELAREEIGRLADMNGAERSRLEAALGKTKQEIDNLVRFIREGHASPRVAEELESAEAQERAIERSLMELRGQPTRIPSLDVIVSRAMEIQARLLEDVKGGREALRGLLDGGTITMAPQADGSYVASGGFLADVLIRRNPIGGTDGVSTKRFAGARNTLHRNLLVLRFQVPLYGRRHHLARKP